MEADDVLWWPLKGLKRKNQNKSRIRITDGIQLKRVEMWKHKKAKTEAKNNLNF